MTAAVGAEDVAAGRAEDADPGRRAEDVAGRADNGGRRTSAAAGAATDPAKLAPPH